jgi:hypothetical protein
MNCSFCGGAYHPSTGCAYTATFGACYSCAVEFYTWLEQRTNSRPRGGRGPSFYDHVAPIAIDLVVHFEDVEHV